MSERNGDKSRFQIRRKAGLRRRERARQAQLAMQDAASRVQRGPDSEQAGGVRGRVAALHLVRGAQVAE
jgi:hypothetical protein